MRVNNLNKSTNWSDRQDTTIEDINLFPQPQNVYIAYPKQIVKLEAIVAKAVLWSNLFSRVNVWQLSHVISYKENQLKTDAGSMQRNTGWVIQILSLFSPFHTAFNDIYTWNNFSHAFLFCNLKEAKNNYLLK